MRAADGSDGAFASGSAKAMLEFLLSKGADVNAASTRDWTALMTSVANQRLDQVQLLLDHKADVNQRANDDRSVLHLAVLNRNNEIVRLLLAHKPNVDFSYLPNDGSNPKVRHTALIDAVSSGDAAITRQLLEAGASPNQAIYASGWTLLHSAAATGSPELVKLLLDHGAAVDLQIDNISPLQACLDNTKDPRGSNLLAVVDALLQHKANVNLVSRYGWTPLMRSVQTQNAAVVARLLQAGAEVNVLNTDGASPLSLVKSWASAPSPLVPPAQSSFGNPLSPPPSSETRESIVKLLKDHGALEDLQRLSAISTSRGAGQRNSRWLRGTNSWNHFTLFELIARTWGNYPDTQWPQDYLAFPDFSRATIHRVDAKSGLGEDIKINLADALEKGECSEDLPLKWGDVLEVPERVHLISAPKEGLSDRIYETLQKCLARTIQLKINGSVTNIVTKPFSVFANGVPRHGTPVFGLNAWLQSSGQLLISSDLSRVKVTRRNVETQQDEERIFNLTINPNDSANDLWLKDGDRIEVIDKQGREDQAINQPVTPAPGVLIRPSRSLNNP